MRNPLLAGALAAAMAATAGTGPRAALAQEAGGEAAAERAQAADARTEQGQAAPGAQEAPASWLHVHVDETDGARVRVNVPVSLVDVALDIAGEEGLEKARIRLDSDDDVTMEDIRRMWRELRDAGDADFVDVRDGDETVRVFVRGRQVHVQVDEDGEEKVRIQMPLDVADTLLGTEGDELDLRGAMEKLARSGSRDLIRVRDHDATVRIWLDDIAVPGS